MGPTLRLGICEVCDNKKALYTCPKCEVKTCSLECSQIHKKELECDGVRCKTLYKPLSGISNLDFLSDYRFLEETRRIVSSCQRNPIRNSTRQCREMPMHLAKLRAACLQRGTQLLFMPRHFSKHIDNTTYLQWETKSLFWKIKWIFPNVNGDPIVWCEARVLETERLSKVVSKFLQPNTCPDIISKNLKFYQAAGLSGITLLLKSECVTKADERFYELDPFLSLRESLYKKTIIEYPIIFVVLKDHKYSFEIIDSDEEDATEKSYTDYGNFHRVNFLKEIKRRIDMQHEQEQNNSFFFGECNDN